MIAMQSSCRFSVALAAPMHSVLKVVDEPGGEGTARYIMVSSDNLSTSSETLKKSIVFWPTASIADSKYCACSKTRRQS